MLDVKARGWRAFASAIAQPSFAQDAAPQGIEVTLTVQDPDGVLARLLGHIQRTAALGHSFSVVVDPGDPDHEAKFGIDGDGAFRISDIKADGKTLKDFR